MGKIMFKNGIKLLNFNLNNKTIIEPPLTDNDIKGSIIYSISNKFYDSGKNTLSAIYRLSSFSSNEFAIYRQSPNDRYKTYLGTVKDISDGIIDYGVASNKQYQYIIQPNPKDGDSISIQTNYLNVHWNRWSIVSLNYDIENDIYYPDDTVFTFRNNLSIGSISDNMNFIKYNTLDKFGRIIQTPQQYDSGSLTCLFGDFKSVYDIKGSRSLILDNSTQSKIREDVYETICLKLIDILNKVDPDRVILREVYLKTITDKDKIVITAKQTKPVTIVQDFILGYNIIINAHKDGNIEIILSDKINNVSYYGYTQGLKDKTTEQIAEEIANALIDNMSDVFVKRLYCEIEYSSSDYEDCYIYFSKYDDYYEKNILWEQVRKQYAYYDDDEKMVLWKQFLQDQKVKLLKSPKGDMWIVSISDQTSRDIQYNSTSYPTTISFNWQEVIDKDKISIMSW